MPQQAWWYRTLGFLTFWLVTSPVGVGALPSYTLTDIGPCEVRGMSQEGVAVIVGDCNNVATVLYPYTRELGVITPGGIGSTAEGTAWRYVVGSSSAGTHGGPTHSFVWTLAGGLQELGTPGASTLSSFAVDVNVGGFIVGYGDHATQDRIIALLWCCGGGVFPLQDLHPRTSSRALSINRWGDVVGSATTPEGVLTADIATLKRVAQHPVICYDNDTNQAGFELVKRLQTAMPVEACTTPLTWGGKSDLDSFIRDFDQDHVAAWEGVKALIAERQPYGRTYSGTRAQSFLITR